MYAVWLSTEKLGPDRRNSKCKGPEVPDMLTRAESGGWRRVWKVMLKSGVTCEIGRQVRVRTCILFSVSD